MVSNCASCHELQISLAEGTPHLNKIPLTSLEPMTIPHIDLFKYKDTDYLVTRNKIATYYWMSKLNRTDTTQIIKELDLLQSICCRTSKIVSDNSSQLVIAQFDCA